MEHHTFLQRVRESIRLQQIYNQLLRFGADAVFSRGTVGGFRRWWQQVLWDTPRKLRPLSGPVRLRLMLQQLGPTYVKVGQLVSSRSGTLPREWQLELAKLQSRAEPFPYEDVELRISEELGGKPNEVFGSFEERPMAAASLAQAHRATLLDGTDVVVKVQRPGIETQVKADIGIMRVAARTAEKRSVIARELGALGVVNEFGKNVIDELDYSIEAYNARRLATNLNDVPGVNVPAIYPSLSTKRVLTMEFVDGVEATEADAIEASGVDREFLATAAVRAVVKMLLIDGFFHADPHPGNVLISLDGDGALNFIDAGMAGDLTLMQRAHLIDLLVVGQQHDVQGLAQSLYALSTPFAGEVDTRQYFREFERRLTPYLYGDGGGEFADRISEAFDVLRHHGLRLDPELTLAVKALVQGEEITRNLRPSPDFDFVSKSVDVTIELLEEELHSGRVAEELKKQARFMLRQAMQELPSFGEATGKWFQQYKRGRLEVHLDTSGLEQQMESVRGIARLVTIGLVVAGMMIGSAVAASVGQASEVTGFVVDLALVAFTAATIVGAILLLILVNRWRKQDQ